MRAQQSGATIYHLTRTFTDTQPCTGETLTGTLDAVFVVAAAWTGTGGLHATIQASSHGELTATDGTVYHFSLAGTEHFGAVAAYFDIPIHAVAASEGPDRNFRVDGFVRTYLDGSPAEIHFTTSCGG